MVKLQFVELVSRVRFSLATPLTAFRNQLLEASRYGLEYLLGSCSVSCFIFDTI